MAPRPLGTEGGVGVTVTVTWDPALPAELVAVRLYVVVCVGETEVDVPVTEPMPLIEMVGVGLPETDQASVLDWPAVMDAGVAV